MTQHLTFFWLSQGTLVLSEDSFDTLLAESGFLLVRDKQGSDTSAFPSTQMNTNLNTAEYGKNTQLFLCGIHLYFLPTRTF